jgi:hypothetical protein
MKTESLSTKNSSTQPIFTVDAEIISAQVLLSIDNVDPEFINVTQLYDWHWNHQRTRPTGRAEIIDEN